MIKKESKIRRLVLNPLAAFVLTMFFATSALGTMYIPPHPEDPQWWKDWWDGTTLTLQDNVSGTIQIDADGVTLDGIGYTVSGAGSVDGIYLNGRKSVTIENLKVQGFTRGIFLYNSSNNTLTGNTASNNDNGIWLEGSNSNTLIGNTTSSNVRHGIYVRGLDSSNILTDNTVSDNNYGIALKHTSHNTLTGNTFNSNNSRGVYLYAATDNCLTGNTISNNDGYGIYLNGDYCQNNLIYNNNFINNSTQAHVEGGSGNVFNLTAPTGGNYWSDYIGVDTNGDGIGDTEIPYTFTGGEDNLPWVRENGWALTPQEAIQNLIDDVAALNLKNGIDNSLDAKLEAAFKALDDVNANNDVAAINALQAFINAVEAQRGNKISDADADALIAAAQQIIAMLSSP